MSAGLAAAIKVLGNVLRLQGRLAEAMAIDGLARPAEPDAAETCFKRAITLLREGRLDESEAHFRESLSLAPDMAASWVGLSQIQSERGEIETSCASAREALALSPRLAEAHWRLATTLRGRLPEAEVRAIERLIADESLPGAALAFLHYGMAAVLDDRGLYVGAAEHLERANALQRQVLAALGRPHDPEADSGFVDRMIAACDTALFDRGRDWIEPDRKPVFVVGLQRSGTTLVEQILASHPGIHGAGELQDVAQIFRSLPDLTGLVTGDCFDALKCLGPNSAKAASRIYLDRLDALAPRGASASSIRCRTTSDSWA